MLQSAMTGGSLFHSSRKLGRRRTMVSINKTQLMICVGLILGLVSFTSRPVAAAVHIEGQVQAGGGPLANSTVTLWAAILLTPGNSLKQQQATMVDSRSTARRRSVRMSCSI